MQSKNLILYIIIGVLLVILIGGGIYLFMAKEVNPSQCINSCGDGICQEAVCQGTGCPCAETKETCFADCKDNEVKGDQIMVEWDEWLSKSYIWNILDSSKLSSMENKDKISKFFERVEVYKIGTISKGAYADKNLYRIEYPCDGPCGLIVHMVIKNDNDIVLLGKYSSELTQDCVSEYLCWGGYALSFKKDDRTEITNLEPASIIQIPNSKLSFLKDQNTSNNLITIYSNVKRIFDFAPDKTMYKTVDGCFVAKANDSTVRHYYFGFGFFKKDGEDMKLDRAMGILDAKWSDGKQNTQEYRAGMYECYDYASDVNVSQLKEVGVTGNGYKLYEPKDKNHPLLKQMYDNEYYPGFDSKTNQAKAKIPYEEFLATHPLVLWQDPFGDFIKFKDVRYAPLAERAKPVIYLYPEKEMDVSVFINPNGGFTFTEPEYKNGWKVKAKPSGEIYNYDDKKIYPYLFWEGKELDYQSPRQGFVIARENVKIFLEEKLLQLGLIKKEYDKFIEFWLPKMQDKKYYFISFTDDKTIDAGASLNISPKPDTIIRVLMDYQGLDEYMGVKEQRIVTPERKGFVVVEWGGMLHK